MGIALIWRPEIAIDVIKPFGTIFLNLLKFIGVPIVIFSIADGVLSMNDIKKLGRVSGRTMVYYLGTTFFAISLGILIANLFKGGFPILSTSSLKYSATESPEFIQTIVNIFPSNIIQPLAEASMLQVIVIALFFGFGTLIAGEKGNFHLCASPWCNRQHYRGCLMCDYCLPSGKQKRCQVKKIMSFSQYYSQFSIWKKKKKVAPANLWHKAMHP